MRIPFICGARCQALLYLLALTLSAGAQSQGLFDGHTDIGLVGRQGAALYDARLQQYSLSGSGANIWGTHDAFHFLWKRLGGNFILQARGGFQGRGADPHRKLGWMVRSGLDSTAAMVSITVHGDGLTALQYRQRNGDSVREVRFTLQAADVLQLEKKGNRYSASAARFGDTLVAQEIAGVDLGAEVYAGLFVCAHNNDATEKAAFENVRIVVPARDNFVAYREYLGSHIETLDVFNGRRQVVYTDDTLSLQAPNWTRDNKALIYNSRGRIYRLDLKSKVPQVVETGAVKANNNDHVLSFDGRMLGLSSASGDPRFGSLVYTVPLRGGTPEQVTPTGPSYLHGWSPDGKYLVYTGQRNGDFDIYRIPANGGPEVRLTTAPGLDDGPEYSPDGKYIYFNSVRSGRMQLWRMRTDGSGQEQLTDDAFNNWFPHISPDGKWIVFLSFLRDVRPDDHPFYRHVYLRLMPVGGGQPKVIAYVYGGQGTINTPSWSPDSRRIAFVSNSAPLPRSPF